MSFDIVEVQKKGILRCSFKKYYKYLNTINECFRFNSLSIYGLPEIIEVGEREVFFSLPVGKIKNRRFGNNTLKRMFRELMLVYLLIENKWSTKNTDFFYSTDQNGENHLLLFPHFHKKKARVNIRDLILKFLKEVTFFSSSEEEECAPPESERISGDMVVLREMVGADFYDWVFSIEKLLFLKTREEVISLLTFNEIPILPNFYLPPIEEKEIISFKEKFLLLNKCISLLKKKEGDESVSLLFTLIDFVVRMEDYPENSFSRVTSSVMERKNKSFSEEEILLSSTKIINIVKGYYHLSDEWESLDFLERSGFIISNSPISRIFSNDYLVIIAKYLIFYYNFLSSEGVEYYTEIDYSLYNFDLFNKYYSEKINSDVISISKFFTLSPPPALIEEEKESNIFSEILKLI